MTLGIRTSTYKFWETHSVHNTHDKNSHPTKKRGELLQLDKDYLQKKPTANITLNGEILDAFPQEQEQGKDVDSYHSFHQSTGSPRQYKKARKRNKRQIRKKEIKLPICRWHVVQA